MTRALLLLSLAGAALTAGAQPAQPPSRAPFGVTETSIQDLQAAMAGGRTTSREVVSQYLVRLGLYEDRLNAAIAVNPRALAIEHVGFLERVAVHIQRCVQPVFIHCQAHEVLTHQLA